jgi:hypothetical protein
MIAFPCAAQKKFTTDLKGQAVGSLFFANGKSFAARQNQAQEPKTVIDTVRIVGGYGSLSLSSKFTSGQHRVAATSAKNIYAQISRVLTDSTATHYSYSYSVADKGARLVIKSSSTADTGKVAIVCYVR